MPLSDPGAQPQPGSTRQNTPPHSINRRSGEYSASSNPSQVPATAAQAVTNNRPTLNIITIISRARTSSVGRHTLVPSGFECVAHPVFFRPEPYTPALLPTSTAVEGTPAREPTRRRHRDGFSPRLLPTPQPPAATTTITTNTSATAVLERGAALRVEDVDLQEVRVALLSGELVADDNEDGDDADADADADADVRVHTWGAGRTTGDCPKHDASTGAKARGRGGREVDVVCPICLGRFEQPVTLTSCLHTFCHTCILGWFEHTVAIALARGDLSAFHPPSDRHRRRRAPDSGRAADLANPTATITSNKKAPVPYRCPLCQIPGPSFLAVEPAARASSKPTTSGKKSKLKFRLFGARTILGGGGRGSGGVEVEQTNAVGAEGSANGNVGGNGYPSMAELRAAARTQLALAAAVSALEGRKEGGVAVVSVEVGGGDGTLDTRQGRDSRLVAAEKINKRAGRSAEGSRVGRSSATIVPNSSNYDGGGGDSIGRNTSSGSSSRGSCSGSRRLSGREGSHVEDAGSIARTTTAAEDRRRADVKSTQAVDSEEWQSSSVRGEDTFRRKNRQRRSSDLQSKRHKRYDGQITPSGMNSDLHHHRHAAASKAGGSSGGSPNVFSEHGGHHNPYGGGGGKRRRREDKKERCDDDVEQRYGRGGVGRCGNGEPLDKNNNSSRRSRHEGGGSSSSGGSVVVESGLPWEPGSMTAEDALEVIEAMLQKEKESLRRKCAGHS